MISSSLRARRRTPWVRIERVGESLFLKVGTKGKNVGVVGYYPNAETKFRFEVVELDRFRFGHDPAIDRRMAEYQQLLQETNLIANEPSIRHEFGEGYEFLGSEKCAECHDEAYEIWKNTPHAHAYESLTVAWAREHEDPGMAARVRVDRVHDPECITCHATGWDPQNVLRFEGGFTGIETTPHSGRRWVARTVTVPRASMWPSKRKAPKRSCSLPNARGST